jgi:general secretion pathway protein H
MRTPTSATDRRGESGFTLVELLAVLAILAIAAGLFSFRVQAGFGTSQFRAFLTDTASAIRETRSAAILGAGERVFEIDVRRRTLGQTALPPGVEISAEVAEKETGGGTAAIRFFKDGSSTGGTLTFAWKERKAAIDVNWLTGNVAIRGL